MNAYQRLHGPPPELDLNDVSSVAAWIEYTRWEAFFRGARHEQISRVEAEALVSALQSERTGA